MNLKKLRGCTENYGIENALFFGTKPLETGQTQKRNTEGLPPYSVR